MATSKMASYAELQRACAKLIDEKEELEAKVDALVEAIINWHRHECPGDACTGCGLERILNGFEAKAQEGGP